MTAEELNTKLYEKLYAEHQEFVKDLQVHDSFYCIELAYELVIREDLLMHVEMNDLSPEQCRALLREKKPMQKLFEAWEKHEGHHMEEIGDCVEGFADQLIRQHRRNREAER